MSKPRIILVPGSWHTAEHFAPLVGNLTEHGYKSVSVSLPSTQSMDLTPATFSDDVTAVRRAVEAELDSGNDVVVVAHSYGAAPANDALQGLDKKANGAKNAVIALVFLCGPIIPAGISFLGQFGGKPGTLHNLDNYPFVTVNEPGPGYYFFNDLPPEEAIKWSSKLIPMSWKAYEEPLTSSAAMVIPSWYLLTTLDNTIPAVAQKYFLQQARDKGALVMDERIQEVAAGHSPYLSQIEKTSAFIRKAASTDY